MTGFIRMDGVRVGDLTVIRRQGADGSGNVLWLCRCECGVERLQKSEVLRRKNRKFICRHGRQPIDCSSPEYRTWAGMKDRCYNANHHRYLTYGGRGIRICDRWRASFHLFLTDMGKKPSKYHSIDRINGDGNYEPSNCRWATDDEQRRNKRNRVIVKHNGTEKLLTDLVLELGLNNKNVYGRLKLGWSLEDAITVPVDKRG